MNLENRLYVGKMYEEGIDVEKNIDLAIGVYEKIAKDGWSIGYFKIGQIYDLGKCVDKDLEKAKRYYEKGMLLNERECTYNLGMINLKEGKYEEGVKILEKAIDLNHYEAFNSLGAYYEKRKDYEKAYFYYKKGEEHESGRSIFGLGVLYENGKGVKKDLEKAKKYYRKSWELGYVTALKFLLPLNECTNEEVEFLENEAKKGDSTLDLTLGKYYLNKGDLEKARIYGKNALSSCSEGVYNFLGSIEQKLRNNKKAMEYYNLGIEKGDIACKYSKGWLSFLLRDYKVAKEIYLELKESKSQMVYSMLIMVFSNLKEYRSVEEYYNLLLEKYRDEKIKRMYGYSQFRLKEYEKAVEIYGQLKNLNQNEINMLGIGYYKIGRYEECLDTLKRMENQEEYKKYKIKIEGEEKKEGKLIKIWQVLAACM